MSPSSTSSARVNQDTRLFLKTIRDEIEDGRKPYASDIRRVIERSLALRFAEYLQFLEKYGFVTFDRRADLLALTRAGDEVIEGHEGRIRGLLGDAAYYFGDRLNEIKEERPQPSVGKQLDKRYIQLDKIGHGGLGTVWRGAQRSIDRAVALKMLDGLFDLFPKDQHEEILRRLEIAVREHARLVSPFIVQILDQNPQHNPPYYVMELAEGGNLRACLAEGPLPAPIAIRYFLQIAQALKTAHDEGVLHRDLRPENVLLDKLGNVKVADFGITRVVERDGASVRQAYIGYGSVGYMAPENFRRGAVRGPGTDIYALGIVLYEMLVGDLPGRRSPMPSEVSEGVPPDVDELFDRMTQDDPKRRPNQLSEVFEFVWQSKDILKLLDPRQAPLFLAPPMPLPGLRLADGAPREDQTEEPQPAPPEPAAAPQPRGELTRRAPIAARPSPRGAAQEHSAYLEPAAEPIMPASLSDEANHDEGGYGGDYGGGYGGDDAPYPVSEDMGDDAGGYEEDDFSRTLQRLSGAASPASAEAEAEDERGRRAPLSRARGRASQSPASAPRSRFDSNPAVAEEPRAAARPAFAARRPPSQPIAASAYAHEPPDDVVPLAQPAPISFPADDVELAESVEMLDVDDVMDQEQKQERLQSDLLDRLRRRP